MFNDVQSPGRSIVLGPSPERLEALIRERMGPGADKKRVDKRIWELFGGRWCVMFTDLSGFSRNVARFGIIHFLQTIYASECLLKPIIEEHGGLVLKFDGDSFLVVFRDARPAARAAVKMQRACVEYNRSRPPEEQVLLCVGIGCGPMLRIGDADIFGAEVNAAAKLGEDIAKSREILVTEAVKRRLGRGLRQRATARRRKAGFIFTKIRRVPPGAAAAYRLGYKI